MPKKVIEQLKGLKPELSNGDSTFQLVNNSGFTLQSQSEGGDENVANGQQRWRQTALQSGFTKWSINPVNRLVALMGAEVSSEPCPMGRLQPSFKARNSQIPTVFPPFQWESTFMEPMEARSPSGLEVVVAPLRAC